MFPLFPSNDLTMHLPEIPRAQLSLGQASPPSTPPNSSPRAVILGGMTGPRTLATSEQGERGRNLQHVANLTSRLVNPIFHEFAYQEGDVSYRSRMATMATRDFTTSTSTSTTSASTSTTSTSTTPTEVDERDPETPNVDPVWHEKEELISHLQQWAADEHVSLDIQRARANVCKQISKQLNGWFLRYSSTKGKLVLTGKVLPHFIFREKFLQDRLTQLTVRNEVMELGIFELHEMQNLQNLTTLEIEDTGVEQIPESIGNLDQLTTLIISNTNITKLPESIGNLINLDTLILEDNKKMIYLSQSLVRLRNLRRLSLQGCVALKSLPDSSSNPLHATDVFYKFGNLRALEALSLKGCSALKEIPQSTCKLSALKILDLRGCTELDTLPACMDALQFLDSLYLDGTKIHSLPNNLYRLAFIKPSGFLPSPWNETVQWMRQALKPTSRKYTITAGDCLRIEIRPDTAVPFAQEHLKLLVKALESNGRLANPPTTVFVTYPGEDPVDVGGLRRDRFRHIFPDYAQQIKENQGPILVYKEERSCFILERPINRQMTSSEIEFCRNTGKLMAALLLGFASFPGLRGEACKIGHVFPEHFYTGLLHAAFYLISQADDFERVTRKEQKSLCRILAINDKNGLVDGAGKLLFDMECLKEEDSSHFSNPQTFICDDDLYKIWKLMNHYEDFEHALPIPSLARFIREEFGACNAFPEGMLEEFRNALNNLDARKFIQSSLQEYMFTQYCRQCEPLINVAQGFRSVLKYFPPDTQFQNLVYQHLINANEAMGLRIRDIPWATMLSNVIQGPSFTVEAFRLLMQRCVLHENTPQAMRGAVLARMDVIKEWYLNEPVDAQGAVAAQGALAAQNERNNQRKKMLRCMNATDVIITDMRPLKFGGPTNTGPYSVFHTCFGSVDLGNALMRLDPVTQKEQLIQTWLEHIDLAMRGAISRR